MPNEILGELHKNLTSVDFAGGGGGTLTCPNTLAQTIPLESIARQRIAQRYNLPLERLTMIYSTTSTYRLSNGTCYRHRCPRQCAGDRRSQFFQSGYITAKYEGQTGRLLWIVSANNLEGTGLALAVDLSGNVYVTGSFSTINGNRNRCLVIKYSGRNGAVLWSRELPGTGNALKLDSANDVYITGTSYLVFFPNGWGDFRTVKLDGRTGTVLWQVTNWGEAFTLQVDALGHVYVAGYYGSPDWPSYQTIKYEQAPSGDVNLDFCVDDGDLLRVLNVFGQSGELPEDVNRDGVVDDQDLLTVLFNFSRGCEGE